MSTYVDIDHEGYSPAALRRLSDRRKLPHVLDFSRSDVMELRAETFKQMSISGVQEKISLRLEQGRLLPATEHGEYILKPIPGQSLPAFGDEVPANESLTMQLAEQLFGIDTAPNALVRLADGELAYLTRRFDRTREGESIAQEDFCQLMGRSPQTAGVGYKYDSSYEALADTMRRFVPAYPVEVEKLFARIVFSYAFGNGDGHLKNFSVQRNDEFGDVLLTPAYDLVCTKLHLPNETPLALDLLADDEVPHGVATHGFITGADLLELARRIGVLERRAGHVLDQFAARASKVAELVGRSFLSTSAQARYLEIHEERVMAIQIRG